MRYAYIRMSQVSKLPWWRTRAADEAWSAGEAGSRLGPRRRKHRAPNTRAATVALQRYRGRVETVNSQLAAWGVQRLHARTHEGWLCKVLDSLFARFCVNADEQSRYDVRVDTILCLRFMSHSRHSR